MKQDYERLDVEDFGRKLIESGDLDPVYIILDDVEWEWTRLCRFHIAYWCLYHVGASAYISERDGNNFWDLLEAAASNINDDALLTTARPPVGDRWPRASERRHFRGQKAVDAVRQLRMEFPEPLHMVNRIISKAPSYSAIRKTVCEFPQFGDWMAFKVADMIERILSVPVDFDLGSVTMFDDPKKAALMVARSRLGMVERTKFKDPAAIIEQVVQHLIDEYKDLDAPPKNDRRIGYQEVETVLCKWKSHQNGHYPLGNDIVEIAAGLELWRGTCSGADDLLHAISKLSTKETIS